MPSINDIVSPEIQALGVRDRLVTTLGRTMQIAERLQSEKAREHMKHGLARRLRILHLGLSKIVAVAYPRRRQPLSDDEQLDLTLHLNSFYLHIRGCLDNLAWCLVYELEIFGPKPQEETVKFKVNLFDDRFLKALTSVAPDLAASVQQHEDWQRDLKDIRDPVAHRIPIYAVGAVLSAEEEERFQAIYHREEEARAVGALDLADSLFKELNDIGNYVPYFAQLPSTTEVRKVYPQVANDLSTILKLVDAVIGHLEKPGV
jgi:hypothetical protein